MAVSDQPPGSLYLVPSPIGNLGDVTYRSIETLSAVNSIACEDTRHSRRLLSRYGIDKPLFSVHEHNEHRAVPKVRDLLESGLDVAYLSNAGTPGISDPGFTLVRMACEAGLPVQVLPGPTALIPALVQSGLPVHSFTFKGFAPRKSGPRRRALEMEAASPHTLIFYESPYRVARLLTDTLDVLGDRPAALVREVTKLHEETLRGTVSELLSNLADRTLKGECVVLVAGAGRGAAPS